MSCKLQRPTPPATQSHLIDLCIDMTAREVLSTMTAMVRKGEFAAAAELGNAQRPPLAVEKSQLGATLGRGSESTIHAAEYNGRDVAVKKMIITCTADLERFRKEVALLSTFQHPHIVPLVGARMLPPDYAMILPRYACSLEVRHATTSAWSLLCRCTFAWSASLCCMDQFFVRARLWAMMSWRQAFCMDCHGNMSAAIINGSF